LAAVKQAVLAASHTHAVAASAATTSGFLAGMRDSAYRDRSFASGSPSVPLCYRPSCACSSSS
jgi:hypothetical protein